MNKISKLSIFIIPLVIILILASCSNDQTNKIVESNYDSKHQVRKINVWDVLAIVSADAAGGYEVGKIGAGLGAVLGGPQGAGVGAVIGALVGGCGASYATAYGLGLIEQVAINPATSPWDTTFVGIDSIGYLHNQLCNHLVQNIPVNLDCTINYTQVYNLSVAFFESRGIDSVEYYLPYSQFINAILPLVEDIIYDPTSNNIKDIYSDICDDLILSNYHDNMINELYLENPINLTSINIIIDYQDNIGSLNLSGIPLQNTSMMYSIYKYSFALWFNNFSE